MEVSGRAAVVEGEGATGAGSTGDRLIRKVISITGNGNDAVELDQLLWVHMWISSYGHR